MNEMNYFHSWNSELLSSKVADYQTQKEIVPNYLYKTTYIPLGITCVLRVHKLVESDLELLENEARLNRLTDHPNLIHMMHHFLQKDRMWYTIFPFSPFSSMDELCKPFGLPETVIALAMSDILQAVDYLHRNNIIHRAIMGSHILLFGDLQRSIKFVLTGLKYGYDMSGRNDLYAFDYPKNAQKILTHLPTEMLEQNIIGYSFKGDIYSIGIVCCELANGITPFDHMPTDQLLFYKMIGDKPAPLDSTCEEMKIFEEYADRLEISLQGRYRVYCQRKFSSEFHEFVSIGCLHCEQSRRLSASELLIHPFMVSMFKKYDRENLHRFLATYLSKKN